MVQPFFYQYKCGIFGYVKSESVKYDVLNSIHGTY